MAIEICRSLFSTVMSEMQTWQASLAPCCVIFLEFFLPQSLNHWCGKGMPPRLVSFTVRSFLSIELWSYDYERKLKRFCWEIMFYSIHLRLSSIFTSLGSANFSRTIEGVLVDSNRTVEGSTFSKGLELLEDSEFPFVSKVFRALLLGGMLTNILGIHQVVKRWSSAGKQWMLGHLL